jgi:hypothetical protein
VTLATTPAIFGVVMYLGFGDRQALGVLCALALISLGLARPRLEQWEEAMAGTHDDAHRPAGR